MIFRKKNGQMLGVVLLGDCKQGSGQNSLCCLDNNDLKNEARGDDRQPTWAAHNKP